VGWRGRVRRGVGYRELAVSARTVSMFFNWQNVAEDSENNHFSLPTGGGCVYEEGLHMDLADGKQSSNSNDKFINSSPTRSQHVDAPS
jgi:hypothetical protein